jgi:hypothetical protein
MEHTVILTLIGEGVDWNQVALAKMIMNLWFAAK